MIRWSKRVQSKQPTRDKKSFTRLLLESLEDRISPATALAPPRIIDPSHAQQVDQNSYTIRGVLQSPAKNNTLVSIYRDSNGNGAYDAGKDPRFASAIVPKGQSAFALRVGLKQDAIDQFFVIASEGPHRSPVVKVLRIVEDSTPPKVTGITRVSSSPTSAGSVQFQVTFSEPVAGVDATDFQVVKTGSVKIGTLAVSGSGATYTVTVNGVSGAGTLGLNLRDDDTIHDILTNSAQNHPLGGSGMGNGDFTSGQTYTIDTVAPTVLSIALNGSTATSGGTAAFTVLFSEPVTGVDAADFALSGSGADGASIASVAGSGASYLVTVKTSANTGSVRLDLIDNDTITDLAGNKLGGTGVSNGNFTAGPSYFVTAPNSDSLATVVVPALNINLLGLQVQTNEITISLAAGAGNGQLLGNLLKTASNLVNLQAAADALNQVLSTTVGLLNTGVLGLNLGGGSFANRPAATTNVLNLHVAPVHVDLLGALVNTSQIDVSITAHSGAGLILGNIVTDLANLFNDLPGQKLTIDTLNQKLGDLLGLVNGTIGSIPAATVPTVQPSPGQILSLTLPALNLNLLGLLVQTSPITVNADAQEGSGNLLGNVLTSLLNTLDATPDKIAQLNNTLNGVLADVIGVLNASSLVVSPLLVGALPPALQTLLSPVLVAPAGSTAPILDLVIASQNGTSPPVDVNLLGLNITTSNIDAHISAVTGDGEILGNLLYNVANLANPNGTSGLLALLNALGAGNLTSTAGSTGGSLSGTTPAPKQLLQIKLNPLNINLLGLQVQSDPITVTISTQGGDGKLLGNLVGAISTLLNLPNVESALNNVLATTVNLVNSISLSLPPGALGTGTFDTAGVSDTPVLDLFVAPIHADLLGLVIDTSPIHLTITAHVGQGLVLGNVVADLAHLFDNPPATLTVDDVNKRLAQLLTELNAQIPGIAPSPTPPVNLQPGQFLQLSLAPINLNLLGLILNTSTITVNAFDQTGNGQLLGNFLSALLNTIDATPGNLTILSQNLNAILAKIIGVLNAAQLTLPASTISALPPVVQTLLSPLLISQTPGASTQVLDLTIASPDATQPPVRADLLGLVVTTSDIHATLDAQTGNGAILGNLVYNAANLLNSGNVTSLLFLLTELAQL